LVWYPQSSFDFGDSFCLSCVQSILDEVDGDLLTSFCGVSYSVQEAVSNLSGDYGFNLPLSAFMADVVQGITERKPVQLVGLSGTDYKFYRYRNVPAFVFGPCSSGMGERDEAVSAEGYMAVIKTHTLGIFRHLWDGRRWVSSMVITRSLLSSCEYHDGRKNYEVPRYVCIYEVNDEKKVGQAHVGGSSGGPRRCTSTG
jgi:hypothetical protein